MTIANATLYAHRRKQLATYLLSTSASAVAIIPTAPERARSGAVGMMATAEADVDSK